MAVMMNERVTEAKSETVTHHVPHALRYLHGWFSKGGVQDYLTNIVNVKLIMDEYSNKSMTVSMIFWNEGYFLGFHTL